MRTLGIATVALCAILLALGSQAGSFADTASVLWDVKFCAPNSAVIGNADACAAVDVTGAGGAASGYDYVSYLEVDAAAGPGGTPAQPYLDVVTTSFQAETPSSVGLGVNTGAAIGAISGEVEFHFESNTPSINAATG